MTANKYSYTCKFCGKEVVSLTKHYKKEHPEHVSEALSDGTQQRIAMGQLNPIEHIKKKPTGQEFAEQKPAPTEVPVEPKEPVSSDQKPRLKPVEGGTPEKSGSFLDCLDDF